MPAGSHGVAMVIGPLPRVGPQRAATRVRRMTLAVGTPDPDSLRDEPRGAGPADHPGCGAQDVDSTRRWRGARGTGDRASPYDASGRRGCPTSSTMLRSSSAFFTTT